MYCKFCGKKNPDGAVFCKECGKNLSGMKDVVKNVPVIPEQQETETVRDFDIFSCPSCRADSEFCYPVVKTNVKTSGGGYSFWNGCCGLILLGPLGLLCGACGGSVRTKVRSETWWVCRQCGKEFMSKQSALEKANTSMLMAALYSFFICWLIGNSIDGSIDFWILAIFVLVVVGLWFSIYKALQDSTGRQFRDLLTEGEQSSFWLRYCGLCAASVIIGFALGVHTIG